MYRNGEFVWEHVDSHKAIDDEEYEVNPTGVDVTVDQIMNVGQDWFKIFRDSKSMGNRTYVHFSEVGGTEIARLTPGYYVVRYSEVIDIPEGHVGFIYPRSTLMRNGVMLFTAVWDAGYEGKGEGGMIVNRPMEIERFTRVGQFTLVEAEGSGESYNGQYQGENTNKSIEDY